MLGLGRKPDGVSIVRGPRLLQRASFPGRRSRGVNIWSAAETIGKSVTGLHVPRNLGWWVFPPVPVITKHLDLLGVRPLIKKPDASRFIIQYVSFMPYVSMSALILAKGDATLWGFIASARFASRFTRRRSISILCLCKKDLIEALPCRLSLKPIYSFL